MYDFEYIIRYEALPYSVKAFTVSHDGFYNIYVNSRLCAEQNAKSIQHELEHIRNGDFDCSVPVDRIERKAHNKDVYYADLLKLSV